MLARVNKVIRSKPMAVLLPAPSGTPSTPGMLTPPRITRDGDDYVFTDGTYAGAVSRTRAYLLDGASVAGRVSGGRFTPGASDAGKLLVYRETVTGSGGSITRQASVLSGETIPSIAALYGTGMGQIPFHLAPEDAVTDVDGNVTAIPNKGGAGAAFDLSVTGSGVTKQSGLLNISSTTVLANMASPADMLGTRMFFVAQPLVSTDSYRYFGSSNTATRVGAGKIIVFRSGPSTTGTISTGVPSITTPTLIEIETDGTSVRAWFNGTSVGTASFAVAAFPIDRIARGNGTGAEFVGLMGDVVFLVTDGSPAMNTPADTIRGYLAAKHGVTLS